MRKNSTLPIAPSVSPVQAWINEHALNAVIESGCSWMHVLNLTQPQAEQFAEWLDANGYEHRGAQSYMVYRLK